MASDPSVTRVEAIVLRTVGPQGSLFELLLPAGMRVLSGELAEIDGLLDDQRFFGPFRDGLDATAAAGIAAVIQPGGSMRDDEVIAAANDRGLAMVVTGMRHFRH